MIKWWWWGCCSRLSIYSRLKKKCQSCISEANWVEMPPTLPTLGHQNFTKTFSNYKSSKNCRKGTERVESNPGNSGTQNQLTHNFLQVTNNLLPIEQQRCTNTGRNLRDPNSETWGGGMNRIPFGDIRALLFNRAFRSRTRQLVSSPATTGSQLPENRQTSGPKVHRFRRPLVTSCRNQFTNPTLRRFGKEIAKMGGRKGEILKSTDTAMVEKVEEARRLQ